MDNFREYPWRAYLSLTSRPLTLCRKSVGMSQLPGQLGRSSLPSQALFVPVARPRCVPVPTTASVFLNIPVPQYTKIQLEALHDKQFRINEDVVLSLVSRNAQSYLPVCEKHDKPSLSSGAEAQSSQQTAEVRNSRHTPTCTNRVSRLESCSCKIYEDNILGSCLTADMPLWTLNMRKTDRGLPLPVSVLEKGYQELRSTERTANRFIAPD